MSNYTRKSHAQGGYVWESPHHPKAPRRYPKAEKLRERALNSSQGGRGRCEHCRHLYSMSYLVPCKFGLFGSEPICRWCLKFSGKNFTQIYQPRMRR